jgi:FkbH-like protein
MARGFDYASMMHSLELQAQFGRARTADLPRLVELQQRTNQFNTTTMRCSREQLTGLMSRGDHRVYAASLHDKFGDVGLVACAIVRDAEGEKVIDSFVMSCRAMGFELERLMLAKVIEAEGADKPFVGRFVPTDRNAPAMHLYSANGFEARSQTEWVLRPGAAAPAAPPWFAVHERR